MSLSPQQVADFKEAFALYDRAGRGSISSDKLGELMRACGTNPSEAEIRLLRSNVGASFTWDTFKNVLEQKLREMGKNFEQDLISAFKVFDDTGSGMIPVNDLRHILRCVGEPLNNDEINKLIAIADSDRSGQVKYSEFAKEINPFRS